MLKLEHAPIVVGLSLTDDDHQILKSVGKLAKRTGSRLILAHAILPFQAYAYAGEGAFYPLASYENSFRELSEVMTIEKLEELKKSMAEINQDGVDIDLKVIHNDPALGIINYAKECEAGLIVCGFHPDRVKNDFLGMSTASLLMSESTRPVLALPLDRQAAFEGPLVFADDLHDETKPSLEAAVRFANDMKIRDFYHLHLNNLSLEEIDKMAETVRSAMVMGRMPDNPDFDRDYYMDKTTEFVSENLQTRFEEVPNELRSALNYETRVAFGSPTKKMLNVLDQLKAEIVAFGTHKFFDRSSWTFGKMPYHAMLSVGRGVLVIPNQEDEETEN
jgi:nucleotide-binding universal stress UspA family protein